MRKSHRFWSFLWYWPLCLCFFLIWVFALRALARHGILLPLLGLRLTVAAGLLAVTGALGGAVAARMGKWRALGVSPGEAAFRGAAYAVVWAFMPVFLGGAGQGLWPFGFWTAGVIAGLLAGVFGGFLSEAEKQYADALRRSRKGDTEGARVAIRRYLRAARKDPHREEHLALAERFLADDGASLEPAAELESAPAPSGSGTEPEASTRPAGLGTEMEASAPPAGSRNTTPGARAHRG